MPRRRYRKKHWLELAAPLVGLLVFVAWVSPAWRDALAGFVVVGVICAGVGLVVWLLVKRMAEKPVPQAQTVYYPAPRAIIPPPKAQPAQFTRELLSELEWRRFEILVTLYFRKTGFEARRTRAGADGGVDIEVLRPGEPRPFALVQCKAWNTYNVGVKPARELYGVMAAQNAPLGFLVTSGEFTNDAREFADGKSLTLISGGHLLKKLRELSPAAHADILHEVTAGDYTTPTCPRCDQKMVLREGPTGEFWGCGNYPGCRQTFNIKAGTVE